MCIHKDCAYIREYQAYPDICESNNSILKQYYVKVYTQVHKMAFSFSINFRMASLMKYCQEDPDLNNHIKNLEAMTFCNDAINDRFHVRDWANIFLQEFNNTCITLEFKEKCQCAVDRTLSRVNNILEKRFQLMLNNSA